jgi:hypothetical protein
MRRRPRAALAQLPAEVQQEGLTVQKKSSAILQFVVLYSENGKQDSLFITNYAVINLVFYPGYPGSARRSCSASSTIRYGYGSIPSASTI